MPPDTPLSDEQIAALREFWLRLSILFAQSQAPLTLMRCGLILQEMTGGRLHNDDVTTIEGEIAIRVYQPSLCYPHPATVYDNPGPL